MPKIHCNCDKYVEMGEFDHVRCDYCRDFYCTYCYEDALSTCKCRYDVCCPTTCNICGDDVCYNCKDCSGYAICDVCWKYVNDTCKDCENV